MLENFLENLQKKPYETRIKILWSTTGVIAVALIILWVVNLKSTIKNSSGPEKTEVKTQSATAAEFASVERVEKSGNQLKIYFNLKNNTNDILNVSKADDITLQISNTDLHPISILDRQGQPFIQKVLSNTQAFGILTFSATTDTTGQLTFDNMVLEKNPAQPLKQVMTLDFTKLNNPTNVRN